MSDADFVGCHSHEAPWPTNFRSVQTVQRYGNKSHAGSDGATPCLSCCSVSFKFCFPLATCLRCQSRVIDAKNGPGIELIGEKKRRRKQVTTRIVAPNKTAWLSSPALTRPRYHELSMIEQILPDNWARQRLSSVRKRNNTQTKLLQ